MVLLWEKSRFSGKRVGFHNNDKNAVIRGKTQTGPRHDKTNKVSVRPAKTQISLGIRPV